VGAKVRRSVEAADLESRLRADGVKIVERPPVDLRALYLDCELAHKRGALLAKRDKIEAELRELGLSFWPAKGVSVCPNTGERTEGYFGVHCFRDERGRIISAKHDFVSQASAFYGASDQDIAEAMEPALRTANEKLVTAAIDNVKKMRRELHLRRIRVRFDCQSKRCPVCGPR
jgi:hypothetical protein